MEKLTYEQAAAKLEKLVAELENGELSLEQTVKKYNEAVKLSGYCTAMLNEAKLKITRLGEDGEEDGNDF